MKITVVIQIHTLYMYIIHIQMMRKKKGYNGKKEKETKMKELKKKQKHDLF